MSINRTLLIAGLVIAGSHAAIAQAPPAPATPPAQTAPPAADRANANCTPTQTNAQGTITPDGKSSENLGDKLAKSDGVLCPPSNVDPAMRAPAPKSDNSNTPVIPPPGSPGGDPSIRPK